MLAALAVTKKTRTNGTTKEIIIIEISEKMTLRVLILNIMVFIGWAIDLTIFP